MRQGLSIEHPLTVDDKGVTYLGCRQKRTTITLPSGQLATAMTYDMEEFLDTCVQKYVELAGPGTTVKNCATPFLQEDHRRSPAGTPGDGPCVECPWCMHTFPPTVLKDVSELEVSKRKKQPALAQCGHPGGQQLSHQEDRGAVAADCEQGTDEDPVGSTPRSLRPVKGSHSPRDFCYAMDVRV